MKSQEPSPPSVALWSVLVGVLISRGDWDSAVDILIKMENGDNITNNNKNNIEKKDYFNKENNYYNNEIKKDNSNNLNNNFNNNQNNRNYKFDNINKKIKKIRYKASDISQTVEIAILYSLEGGLPLLTKTSSKALLAMDLQRLLPKDQILITENIEVRNKNIIKLQNNDKNNNNNITNNDQNNNLNDLSDSNSIEKSNSNINNDIKSLLISDRKSVV